jgi:hypothetical protein
MIKKKERKKAEGILFRSKKKLYSNEKVAPAILFKKSVM